MTSIVSVNLTEDEVRALNDVAPLYDCSIPSLLRRLAFAKIEDEYDITVFEEHEDEVANGTFEAIPFSKVVEGARDV